MGRCNEGGEAPGGPGATTAGAPTMRGVRRGVAVNTGLYSKEEQRRPPGCIAGRMPTHLGERFLFLGDNDRMTRVSAWTGVAVLAGTLVAASQTAPPAKSQHGRLFPPQDLGLLEAPDRDEWQRPQQILDAMSIADAAVVADIGAGVGLVHGAAGAAGRAERPRLRPGRAAGDAGGDHPAGAARGTGQRQAGARPWQRSPPASGRRPRRRAAWSASCTRSRTA